MELYSKRSIKNSVSSALSEGQNLSDTLDLFLSMKMANDLGEQDYHHADSLSPQNIRMNLLDNGVIENKDITIEYRSNGFRTPRLVVALSPSCKLYGDLIRGMLQLSVNDKIAASIYVRFMKVGDVVLWLMRQKRNLDKYMSDWDTVLKESAKKSKGNRLALLAIKAIFRDAMKGYPDLEYAFIEQKRRVRIRVKLPNCRLGVLIDGWWGSYKERLPQQIEDLKALIEIHSKTNIKDFFIAKH